ncbi:hypothetical protein BCR44DRAFT_74930 [Catenaria anguillulae PL171]|uniref:PIN domain-like protein n=1 Tax=Catenaria anguillulae PL171 TaxID=765915 RepID=A0A1Y2I0H6_9FUNG|nr:hypothetical protein BCR44DRAFT_74930 [Catenaria anguillulae PL171]
MGVKNLWQILAPASRAVRLETLQGQVLAIDASIWLFQFLKAMRDTESGESLEGSHLLGFFRRICKLLFWGVKPIFVFDGAPPALKQATLAERRKRKEGKAIDVTRTARQLLSTQLQLASIDQSGGAQPIPIGLPKAKKNAPRDPFALPSAADWSSIVHERATRGAGSRKNEDIRMPMLREELEYESDAETNDGSLSLANPDAFASSSAMDVGDGDGNQRPARARAAAGVTDSRYDADEAEFLRHLAMLQSLESSRTSGAVSQAQVDQDAAYAAQQFKSMPIEAQHELLTKLKDRSRAPSLRRVAKMIRASQSAMDFSKLQIQALMRRNFLTQTLHEATGFAGAGTDSAAAGASAGGGKGRVRRIASDRHRAYVLTKNDNGIGFKFDAAKDQGPQILEANEIDRTSLEVVARDRASFPLVGVDKVLEFVGEDVLDDQQRAEGMDGQYDEDDEDMLQFEPVVAASLPPEVADMLDILPVHFSNTFALGTEMLHSTVGWTAGELQQALMDCRARLGNVKLLLSSGDQEQVEHYENLTFWADFLDMMIARRERLDREAAERMAAEATAAAAVSSRKRGRQVFALDSDSDSGSFDGDIRPAKRFAGDDEQDEMDPMLASSSSDVIISHPVDGGFIAPLALHARRSSFSQSSASSSAAPAPSRRSNMFAVLDDSDSDSDSEPAHSFGDSVCQDRSQDKVQDADSHDDMDIQKAMWDSVAYQHAAPASLPHSPDRVPTSPIPSQPLVVMNQSPPTPRPRFDLTTLHSDNDSDDDAIFEPDTTTSCPAPPVPAAAKAPVVDLDEGDKFDVATFTFVDIPQMGLPPVVYSAGSQVELQDVEQEHFDHSPGPKQFVDMGDEDDDEDAGFVDVVDMSSSSPAIRDSPSQSTRPESTTHAQQVESTPEEKAVPSLGSLSPQPAHAQTLADETHEPDHASDDEDELFMIAVAQRAEEDQFSKFLSDLQQRDLTSIQADLERERASLEAKIRTERRDADVVTPEMVAETQALLRLFGIPYITAPAEAEAQCAWLAKEGLVDGVVSDDSDTFLFGAPIVYKNMFTNAKYVECYTSEGIEQALQLDVSSLIQLAYLLGSDYTTGIQGIGAVLAMETLAAFPRGLQEFAEWARDPKASSTVPDDPQATATRKKLKRVAANVPTHFPDPAVEQAYLRPEVDESRDPYSWGVPDVNGIKQLLWERLAWHPDKTESTLNPVITAYNKARAGGGLRQTTLFGFGFTGYIPNSRTRTKGITSDRMKKAIDAKRTQKGGASEEAAASSVKCNGMTKAKATKGHSKNKGSAAPKRTGRRRVAKKAAVFESDSEPNASLSDSESGSSGLSDVEGADS